MRSKYLMCALLLTLPLTPGASPKIKCSIHAPKDTSRAEMARLATTTRQDAEIIAIANLARKPGAIASADLELESGCLVWAFDFKRADKPGFIKVTIDAGNGKFLMERAEGPQKDALVLDKKH